MIDFVILFALIVGVLLYVLATWPWYDEKED